MWPVERSIILAAMAKIQSQQSRNMPPRQFLDCCGIATLLLLRYLILS